jgi:hypothetical protein
MKVIERLKEKVLALRDLLFGKQSESKDDKWYMAGSEESGEYYVILCGKYGRLGVRELSWGWRVRIEPTDQKAADKLRAAFYPAMGWKQPGDDGQFRFSSIYSNEKWTKDEIMCLVFETWAPELQGRWQACLLNPAAMAEPNKL